MDEAEWKARAANVVLRMRDFTKPFVCPISYDDGQVKLQGTGSFIDLLGKKFLLSNEHVLARGKPMLSHGIYGTESVFRCHGLHVEEPNPFDMAIFAVDTAWKHAHEGQTLTEAQFAPQHKPIEDEILFFKGYAKEDSKFFYNTLLSGATSYATQIRKDLPAGFKSDRLFLLHHKPENTEMLDGDRDMPLPPGFSGATVWNTRFVECTVAGKKWTPEEARVTGLVCRWTTGDPGIVVIKVEILRSWLLSVVQKLAQIGKINATW